MREIDTDALLAVAPALGVGNPASATRQVVFDDENLQQAISVNELVRRARAGFGAGIWQASIISDHVAAGTVTDDLDPYNAADMAGAYRALVDQGHDVWALTSRLSIDVSTDFLAAVLQIKPRTNEMGVRNTIAATGTSAPIILGSWDSVLATFSATTATVSSSADPRLIQPVHIRRISRGQVLSLASESGGVAAFEAHCRVALGVFPAGLGQDVAL